MQIAVCCVRICDSGGHINWEGLISEARRVSVTPEYFKLWFRGLVDTTPS